MGHATKTEYVSHKLPHDCDLIGPYCCDMELKGYGLVSVTEVCVGDAGFLVVFKLTEAGKKTLERTRKRNAAKSRARSKEEKK